MFIKTILLSVFVLLTFKVEAAIPTLPCIDCSSFQKERLAETVGRFGRLKQVVIMDYETEIATKYSVHISQGNRGEPISNIYTQAMTSEELNDANMIFEYRREIVKMIKDAQKLPVFNMDGDPIVRPTNGTLGQFKPKTYTISTPNRGGLFTGELVVRGNPYDFITTSRMRNLLFDYYTSGASGTLDGIIASTLGKLEIPFVKDMNIVIKINFIDIVDDLEVPNGTAILKPDFTLESFDVLKAEDKDSNTLPTDKTELDGQQYVFTSGGSRDAFLGWYGG